MYSITDLSYFRLVSTGTYYLVPSEYRHLFLKKKSPGYNYRHTADTTLAYSKQRREEIEKAKIQGERGRQQDRKFQNTNHDNRERARRLRYIQTQTDIEIQRAGEG